MHKKTEILLLEPDKPGEPMTEKRVMEWNGLVQLEPIQILPGLEGEVMTVFTRNQITETEIVKQIYVYERSDNRFRLVPGIKWEKGKTIFIGVLPQINNR